ncbi:MAG: hypothetical protein V3T08_09245 [Gemmatimonadota bacterium]
MNATQGRLAVGPEGRAPIPSASDDPRLLPIASGEAQAQPGEGNPMSLGGPSAVALQLQPVSDPPPVTDRLPTLQKLKALLQRIRRVKSSRSTTVH